MLSKSFINQTKDDIEITLYIAGKHGKDLQSFGSRVELVQSGDERTVPFGDLHHAFLQGIRVKTLSTLECMSLQRGTRCAEGPLYALLNDHDCFQITSDNHSFAIEPVL